MLWSGSLDTEMSIESDEPFDHEGNSAPGLPEIGLGSRKRPPWATGRLPDLTKAETDRMWAMGELLPFPKAMVEVIEGQPTYADVKEHNRQAVRKAQHAKAAKGGYDWEDEFGQELRAPPGPSGVVTTESLARGARQPACSSCGSGTGLYDVKDNGDLVCTGGCQAQAG